MPHDLHSPHPQFLATTDLFVFYPHSFSFSSFTVFFNENCRWVIGTFKTREWMTEKFSGIQELATQSGCSDDSFLGLVLWVLVLSAPFLRTCWDADHEAALSPEPWALSQDNKALEPRAPCECLGHTQGNPTPVQTQISLLFSKKLANWRGGSRPAHCSDLELRGSVPVGHHPAMWSWLSQERMNIPGFEVATVQVIEVWGCLLRISVSTSSFLRPDFPELWPRRE